MGVASIGGTVPRLGSVPLSGRAIQNPIRAMDQLELGC